MSGVACATLVTPSHRRPVLAPDCLWENGCHGPTVRGYVETENPLVCVGPRHPSSRPAQKNLVSFAKNFDP